MLRKKTIEKLKESFGKCKDDDFRFDLIEKYFLKKDNSASFQVLSDKTCKDLDFDELFLFIDRTSSKVGQQCLYNKLKVIPDGITDTDLTEALIEKLTSDVDFRLSAQLQLEKLKKMDVYYIASLFQEEHQKPPKWFFIIKMLSFTSFLSLVMFPFTPQFLLVFFVVFFSNMGIHYWNKRNLYEYLGSLPQLLRLNTVAKNLYKDNRFRPLAPDLTESIQTINKVRNRMSFFRLEANIQGDLNILFWGVLELFKIAFLLEPLLLFGVLRHLESKRKEIENVFAFVGEVDVLISIASLRDGLDQYCRPELSDSELVVKSVYHPLIPYCVTNSIQIEDKSILLTGSNMSGKTSFIRAVGLNVITGLTIHTCFAESMVIPKMKIYSAIRISDDLMNDKSYYFEEVLTIKEMVDESSSGMPNLFLLDEIFKGTNTIERISAGKAVLSTISKNRNIVFVSTHDLELTEMLSDEYELYHFSEIVKENNIDFDYKLKEGKLKNRNAIRILQINNYPSSLIKDAIETSKKMEGLSVAPVE